MSLFLSRIPGKGLKVAKSYTCWATELVPIMKEYAEVLNKFKLYIFNNILSYLVCSVLCQHEVSAA